MLERGYDHEYLPSDGIPSFVDNAAHVALGKDSSMVNSNLYSGCQTISGSGAIRVFFDFMKKWYNNHRAKVFVPSPTWPTHKQIIRDAGWEHMEYRYYDPSTRKLDINGLLEDLDWAPKEQIVLFHTCAHNPTGCDPTEEQWK